MYSSRRGTPGGAKSATACITSLRTLQAEIILVDFNLAVSTQTAKPPNLIPRQIFRLYGTYIHTHSHTYIHTYLHTYIHIYVYVHTGREEEMFIVC